MSEHFQSRLRWYPGKGSWKNTASIFNYTRERERGKTRHFQSHPGKGTRHGIFNHTRKGTEKLSIFNHAQEREQQQHQQHQQPTTDNQQPTTTTTRRTTTTTTTTTRTRTSRWALSSTFMVLSLGVLFQTSGDVWWHLLKQCLSSWDLMRKNAKRWGKNKRLRPGGGGQQEAIANGKLHFLFNISTYCTKIWIRWQTCIEHFELANYGSWWRFWRSWLLHGFNDDVLKDIAQVPFHVCPSYLFLFQFFLLLFFFFFLLIPYVPFPRKVRCRLFLQKKQKCFLFLEKEVCNALSLEKHRESAKGTGKGTGKTGRELEKRKGTGKTQHFVHAEEKELEKRSIFNHSRERELEKHGIFNRARERELEKHGIFNHTREREVEKHGIFNHTRERELEKHGIFNHTRERELDRHGIFNHTRERELEKFRTRQCVYAFLTTIIMNRRKKQRECTSQKWLCHSQNLDVLPKMDCCIFGHQSASCKRHWDVSQKEPTGSVWSVQVPR